MLKKFPEALFNLQFFNPYLKKHSTHSYANLMQEFKNLKSSKKNHFCKDLQGYIKELKKDILELNKDEDANKVTPLMHISMFMITYFLCKENERDDSSHDRDFEKR